MFTNLLMGCVYVQYCRVWERHPHPWKIGVHVMCAQRFTLTLPFSDWKSGRRELLGCVLDLKSAIPLRIWERK